MGSHQQAEQQMKSPVQAISIAVLLVSLATAQNSASPAAEIQSVHVAHGGGQTNLQLTLTSPVTPNVIVATGPHRLVVELPNTTANDRQQHIAVNQDGIKGVRIGLNSANPPVTRVIIDLDQAREYRVASDRNTITLTVLPVESGRERKGAPVPAASAPIWGRLRPQKKDAAPAAPSDSTSEAAIAAPKPFPPIQLPDGRTVPTSSSSTSTASNSPPTAAHPNYGSLQEGTVFPTAGAPGTGYVPGASNATATAVSNPSATSATTTPAVATTSAPITVTPAPPPVTKPVGPGTSVASTGSTAATTVTTTVVAHVDSIGGPGSAHPDSTRPVLTVPPAPVVTASLSRRQYPTAISISPEVANAAEQSVPAVNAAVAKSQPLTTNSAISHLQPTQSSPASASQAAPVVVATAQPLPSAPAAAGTPATPNPITAGPALAPVPDEALPALATRQPNTEIRMGFKIKYVAAGAAYLEGGRNAGLSEGMKLEVRDNASGAASGSNEAYGPEVAQLEILSVADTSTVAEIHDPKRDIKKGDWAYLSSEDTQSLVAQRSLSPTRKYPVVVSFTEGADPLAEEAHADVPRPPMPDINRARGRFGFDYSGIMGLGANGFNSSSMGISVQTDITRIGGTYWNMNGYWRGRLTSTSGAQTQTLQDLINRTYHLGMTYDNPTSHFVAGFGRLFIPYATSLETIDGGYIGFRVSKVTTLGVFAGSTPDPTSYSYNPQQQIGGTFVNVQAGDYQAFRYTDTFGLGIEMLKWKVNRPFVFGENLLSYKRVFSLYSAVQADSPAGNPQVSAPGAGLSRSFTTFRVQPFSRIEFDLNHTYFRDIPTYDPTLISTGLLDKYLFQGFSAGTRVEVLKDIWLYTTLGRSSRSGDKSTSLNQLYGITFNHLPRTKIRTDVHYSKFSSAFGSGSYESASISRSFRDSFRWEILAGQQAYMSSIAAGDKSHFVTGNLDMPLGRHYYVQSGFTWNRGGTQNYNQMLFTFGYRFDTRNTRSK
jgi:hypothetical protein